MPQPSYREIPTLRGVHLARRARRHIELNYRATTTAKLAWLLGVSASFLCHRYRAAFGVTMGQDIRRLRIRLARHLIDREPERLIKEIAAEVGYVHVSYRSFFNAFRSETGMSPSTYQKIATIRPAMPSAHGLVELPEHERRTA